MPRFRKKPVVIKAVQWTGENLQEVRDFYSGKEGGERPLVLDGGRLLIDTLEGPSMRTSPGDWIIKGVEGEFYPCSPSVFEKTYEPVDD